MNPAVVSIRAAAVFSEYTKPPIAAPAKSAKITRMVVAERPLAENSDLIDNLRSMVKLMVFGSARAFLRKNACKWPINVTLDNRKLCDGRRAAEELWNVEQRIKNGCIVYAEIQQHKRRSMRFGLLASQKGGSSVKIDPF